MGVPVERPQRPELGDRSLQVLLNATSDAMFVVDDDGGCVDMNPAACRLLKLSKLDFIGHGIAEFLSPASKLVHGSDWIRHTLHATGLANSSTLGATINSTIDSKISPAPSQPQVELELIRPDGEIRRVECGVTAHFLSHLHLVVMRDVTELRQLKQDYQCLQHNNQHLKASQEKYQTLFEILPVGVSVTDTAGNLIETNPASEQILGLPTEAHNSRTFDEENGQMIHPDGNLMEAQEYASVRALRENCPITNQVQGVIRPDGTVRWIRISAVPIPLAPYGAAIAYVDITEQKQIELALQRQSQQERALNEVVKAIRSSLELDQIFEVSALEIARLLQGETTIVQYLPDQRCWQHRAAFDVDGTRPDKLDLEIPDSGNPIADQLKQGHLVQVGDATTLEDAVNRELAAAFPGTWLLVPIIADDGVWGSLTLARTDPTFVWEADEIQLAQRVANQLAIAIHQANLYQQYRQREQEFRALAENAPDCIVRCDRQFRFLYVNPAALALAGASSPDVFLGKTSAELGFSEHLVTLWHEAMERVFNTGQEQGLEYEVSTVAGLQTSYSRIVPEFDPDESVRSVLVVARDITDLKRAQTDLLVQAERERLLSVITKHIRQSLNLDRILTTAVKEVRHLLQADRALIYRFNPDWSGEMIAESVIPPWQAVLGSHLHDPCFMAELVEAYRRGKTHSIDDINHSPVAACYVELLKQFDIRANLVVPISDGVKLWGLFCINHCEDAHVWQPWEVTLLQRLADQLAIAIQQSELYQQIQQWADTLEDQVRERTAEIQQALDFEAMLKRITDRVRDSLDEDQILETVVQELGTVMQLECCDTGIYSADHSQSTITHEFTRSLPRVKGITFDLDSATHREIYPFLLNGNMVQFCDYIPHDLRLTQKRLTILACPIQDDQAILGDMWLMKATHHVFAEAELRLVQQVANQCAIALRQSRLYQAAQEQVAELERLNNLKDDFLSTVSHELRTPMANIKMATEMLEIQLRQLDLLPEDFDEDSPDAATPPTTSGLISYFKILKNEGFREISLINDLLDLTRLDAHTEPFNLILIDLHTWIPYCLEAYLSRARQLHLDLVFELSPTLPTITTDASYLQRILTELVSNACKYTPAGETICIAATPQAHERDRTSTQPNAMAHNLRVADETYGVELRVSNSGVEIPKDECDRIFDRFYRIPNNDPWKHGGTGLGLALVKKLVEYLGGHIHAESQLHQFQVIIWLPLQVEVTSEE